MVHTGFVIGRISSWSITSNFRGRKWSLFALEGHLFTAIDGLNAGIAGSILNVPGVDEHRASLLILETFKVQEWC